MNKQILVDAVDAMNAARELINLKVDHSSPLLQMVFKAIDNSRLELLDEVWRQDREEA